MRQAVAGSRDRDTRNVVCKFIRAVLIGEDLLAALAFPAGLRYPGFGAGRVLLVDLLGRDKIYAFEDPSYEKIGKIYRATGVKYEKLPLSEDGIDSAALASSKADVLHTTPCRSFPSGVTASASKRHEYIRWADKAERFIIESDYDSEFAVAAKPADPIFALADKDNVIYLNTFSKTISPSLRIGYMVLPKKLVKPFEEKVGFYSCTVPTYEQFVLTELLNSGDFERHINRVRRAKRKELQNG